MRSEIILPELERPLRSNTTSDQTPLNWFSRHPKKTLGLVLFLVVIILTWAAEKILSSTYQGSGAAPSSQRRYINLRENLPLTRTTVYPDEQTIQNSDSLVIKPYRLRTDQDGFVLPAHNHPQPDCRIVFLGASTTLCLFVEEENRFPYLVGKILEEKTGKKINTYNSGVGGNNSLNSLDILINKLIPLQPRIVVLLHNINDLTTLLYGKTYWTSGRETSPIIDFYPYKTLHGTKALLTLARDTYIPNLHFAFRKLVHSLKGPKDDFARRPGTVIQVDQEYLTGEFQASLESFIDLCKVRKIQPVLMTQQNRFKANPDPVIAAPFRQIEADYGISYQVFQELYASFNELIRETGRKQGVPVIDLARLIPAEKEYIYDPVHFNDAGSRLAARIIADNLQKFIP
jgi:lysophospholipase L1-like esterase